MPKAIDHDQLFKQLISTFFLEFLDLFSPELAVNINRDNFEFLPQEYFTDLVEGERRAMDLVVRINLRRRPNEPEEGKVWAIIDCEHQSSSEANFKRRMFFYFAQLHRKYLEPVYPIAIFSFDEPKRQEQNKYLVRLPGLDVLEFNFLANSIKSIELARFLEAEESGSGGVDVENEDRAKRSGEGKSGMFAIDCQFEVRSGKGVDSIGVCR